MFSYQCNCLYLGPGGVKSPFVTVQSATSMDVTWEEPIQSNGQLEYYMIKINHLVFEIRNISQRNLFVDKLVPYTEYSVSVTACTSKCV